MTGIPGFVEEGGSTGVTDPKPDPGVNPITDSAPDPGKLYCYTYPTYLNGGLSAFGMIYYYADDGNDGEAEEAPQKLTIPQNVPSNCATPDMGETAVIGLILGAGYLMGGSGYGGGGVQCHTY